MKQGAREKTFYCNYVEFGRCISGLPNSKMKSPRFTRLIPEIHGEDLGDRLELSCDETLSGLGLHSGVQKKSHFIET